MEGRYRLRCRDCAFNRRGPYVSLSTMATKHSLKNKHHVQVFEPGGLLIHDMDFVAIQHDMEGIPPF